MALSTGFNAGLGLGRLQETRKRAQIAQQSNQIAEQQKIVQTAQTNLKNTFETAANLAQNAIDSGKDPEQVSQLLTRLFAPGIKANLFNAESAGVPLGDPDQMVQVLQSLALRPTPEQLREQKAEETKATQTAELEAGPEVVQVQGGTPLAEKFGITGDGNFEVKFIRDENGEPKITDINSLGGQNINVSTQVNTGDKLTDSDRSKIQKELREKKIGVEQFAATVEDVKRTLVENPDAATAGGTLAAFAKNLQADVKGIANALAMDTSEVNLDPDSFTGEFGELAGASKELKSLAINLAFALAVSRGQTGRALSDRDLELFMEEIGLTQNSDPKIISRVMDSVVERMQRNFVIRRQNVADFLELEEFEGFNEPPNKVTPGKTDKKDKKQSDIPSVTVDSEGNILE